MTGLSRDVPGMETMNSTYTFDQTYEWNYKHGPAFDSDIPEIPSVVPVTLLGHTINSPLGISAGILLNSRWISLYASLGFDVLTYKTVRSATRACYPMPNWVFLHAESMLRDDDASPLIASAMPVLPPEKTTSAVCFGMPSMAPGVWRPDVTRAKRALSPGQILNVSIVGTPDASGNMEALAEDYARCAAWAVESGADWIEANLSCPNVCTSEGELYQDTEAVQKISNAIRASIPASIPLLLKIGLLPNAEAYRDFIRGSRTLCEGIVLVNCVARTIQNPDGTPTFGPGKESAGVLGWATRKLCLQHTKWILRARDMEESPQAILSVGGVLTPDDATAYRECGTDCVLMGGAPAYDPFLAIRIRKHLQSL